MTIKNIALAMVEHPRARVSKRNLLTMSDFITVHAFMEGVLDTCLCPHCRTEIVYADFDVTYTGTGATQHAVIALGWQCACGRAWTTEHPMRYCWMLNDATNDVFILHPSNDMADDYYTAIVEGYVPGKWCDVRALQMRIDELQYVGGAA